MSGSNAGGSTQKSSGANVKSNKPTPKPTPAAKK